MVPFAVRIIVIPAVALAAAIAAFVYFRPTEKPSRMAIAPQTAPAPVPAAPKPSPPDAATPQSSAALPQAATDQPSAAAASKPPEFDVVRVTPNGETVVAGRAPGGARVELLDQGRVIASDKVDRTGQFVLLPPALPGGDHLLALRVTPEGQPAVASSQSVAVAVRPGTAPVVTLAEPGKPSVVLATPAAPSAEQKRLAVPPTTPDEQVTIRTAEVETGGRFFATGTAPPGATVRLYLNGSHVADAGATSDGKWSLTINKGLAGGRYALRADAVTGQGKVVARAEVPFDAPVAVAAPSPPVPRAAASAQHGAMPPVGATPPVASRSAPEPAAPSASLGSPASPNADARAPQAAMAPQPPAAPQPSGASAAGADSANPVVPEIATATVSRGDSLWRISRLRFGKGVRYTVIYEANAGQIRNPDLIYPGQILVMPQN
jgi:nucleoid-associated protein YgaU